MRKLTFIALFSVIGAVQPAQAASGVNLSSKAWHAAIRKVPLPRKGCYEAHYPKIEWNQVRCLSSMKDSLPFAPRFPNAVGGGNDFLAQASSLGSVEGTFPQAKCLLFENDFGYGPLGGDAFQVQMTTGHFSSSLCASSSDPNCRGVQQFIYSQAPYDGEIPNSENYVGMQYFLTPYQGTCPAGFAPVNNGSVNQCFSYSSSASITPISVQALPNMMLSAAANNRGLDTVIVSTSGVTVSAVGNDSVLGLGGNWQMAEFNVFGAGGASAATFNNWTTLGVHVSTFSDSNWSTPVAATCSGPNRAGVTLETNNLNLGNCTSSSTGISFTQSNAMNPNYCLPVLAPAIL